MKDVDLAERVLSAAFPDECSAVGQSTIRDILSGDVVLATPQEGRPLPIGEIFQFLKDAAEVTLALIAIYKALEGQSKKKPTATELKSEVAKRHLQKKGVSEEQVKSIINQIKRLE